MLYDPLRRKNVGSPYLRRDSYHPEKMPSLTPISEVRRVTFAARYVQDEENHNLYTPVDLVRIRFIPSMSEFEIAEKRDTWYSNEEIKTIKQKAVFEANKLRDAIRSHNYRASKHYRRIRGLERLVYNHNNLCARIRYDSLCAVLKEQYHQRRRIYGVHNPGGIVHPGGHYLNNERIREVAITRGETIMSLAIARDLAKQDRAEADAYLERRSVFEEEKEDDTYRDDISDTSSKSCDSRQQEREQLRDPQDNQASQPCWGFGVLDMVRRSLLFQAVLTPFLQVHRGDALLE